MTEVSLLAAVTFSPAAQHQPRFPILQPIRMSLWAPGAPHSVPSEFQVQQPVHPATGYELRIITLLPPALADYLRPGKTILFGLFPHAAGEGRLLGVEPIPRGPAVWVTPKTPNGPI